MSTDTTIEVYCDDESHAHRRWIVASVMRGDGLWHASGGAHGRGTGSAVQFLADDDRMTGRHPDSLPDDDSPVGERLRMRYRLRCRLCGRTVVLREDKAVPVFETLTANNIHAVSLRGLAAIV